MTANRCSTSARARPAPSSAKSAARHAIGFAETRMLRLGERPDELLAGEIELGEVRQVAARAIVRRPRRRARRLDGDRLIREDDDDPLEPGAGQLDAVG